MNNSKLIVIGQTRAGVANAAFWFRKNRRL
jgi:hypothetical protein